MESIKTGDFRRLSKVGIRAHPARWMLICAVRAKKPKLGITIPKTTGNAVLRNKLKRWTRQCVKNSKNLPNAEINVVLKKGKIYKELKYYEFEIVIQKGLVQISKNLYS